MIKRFLLIAFYVIFIQDRRFACARGKMCLYGFFNLASGRYLQSDPVGLGGDVNAHAYVAENRVSNTDSDNLPPSIFPLLATQFAPYPPVQIVRHVGYCPVNRGSRFSLNACSASSKSLLIKKFVFHCATYSKPSSSLCSCA